MFQSTLSKFIFIIFIVSAILNCTIQTKNKKYLNLNFESNLVEWFAGGKGYQASIDSEIYHSGNKSLKLTKTSKGGCGLGTSTFPTKAAEGKHLIYTGYIKTKDINEGYAGLWWRADGENRSYKLDNMRGRGATGTSDWKKFSIEMDIPENITNINFGVMLPGNGTAWFDNLEIFLDGKKYEQTEPEIFSANSEQINWLKKNTIKFSTSNPKETSEDLLPLKNSIADAEIISLGEGTHGTSEFFKMKHRITKFVAEQSKNVIFAIEASMPECRKINDYVLYGKGNPKEALKGIYFWTWNTQEVLDMIMWMREFNLSGKEKIEFWGFDMQFPHVAISNVKSFIKKYDPVIHQSVDKKYTKVLETYKEIIKQKKISCSALAETWFTRAEDVFNHLETNRDRYYSICDKREVEFIIQDARIVVQGAMACMFEKQSRDESMALNVKWIKEQNHKDAKLVLWAHNGHVCKNEKRMGKFLDEIYDDKMLVMGFAFHSGKYTAVGNNSLDVYGTSDSDTGSLEWVFHKAGIERGILDIREIKNDDKSGWLNFPLNFRSIGSRAMDYAFYSTNVSKEYDFIIYFDKTTPSNCFNLKK